MPGDRAGDPLRTFRRLHEKVADLAGRLAAANAASAVPVEGQDRTGTVLMVLGPDGRVDEVRVSAEWRRTLGAEGLADAVRQAWQAAGTARVSAWAEALDEPAPADGADHADRAGGVGASAVALPPGAAAGDLMSYQVQSNLSGLMSLLADAEDSLDRAGRATTASAQGHDPAHRVTAVVTAGELDDVTFDRRWLAEASPGELGRAVNDAIVAAQAAYERARAADSPPALRELRELTADPLTMLRTVGLLRD